MKLFSGFCQDSLRRYALNTGWLVGDKVLRLGLALLISITLARTLGPSRFGLLQYAVSFVGLFGMLPSLGMDTIIVQQLVRQPSEAGLLLATAGAIRMAATCCIVLIVLISSQLLRHDDETTIMVAIIVAGLLFHPMQVLDQYFYAHTVARISAAAYILAALGGGVWIICGVTLHAPIIYFSVTSLLESALIAVGLYMGFRAYTGNAIGFHFDRRYAILLLKECWPLALAIAMISVYANIDKVMIREMLSDEATGIYAAAAKLSEAWYFVPMAIVNSLFPVIVRAREVSLEHYHKRLQNLYNLMVWLAVVIALPVSIFADWIIVFLYGEAYRSAGTVLSLHIWTGVLVFLGVASGRWLILEGYTQAYLARTLVGVVANIALNLLLIPALGVIGAAWATLLAQVLVVLVFDALWPPSRNNYRMKCRALIPIHLIVSDLEKRHG